MVGGEIHYADLVAVSCGGSPLAPECMLLVDQAPERSGVSFCYVAEMLPDSEDWQLRQLRYKLPKGYSVALTPDGLVLRQAADRWHVRLGYPAAFGVAGRPPAQLTFF